MEVYESHPLHASRTRRILCAMEMSPYALLALDEAAQVALIGNNDGQTMTLQWRRPTHWPILAHRYRVFDYPVTTIRLAALPQPGALLPNPNDPENPSAVLPVRQEWLTEVTAVLALFDTRAPLGEQWFRLLPKRGAVLAADQADHGGQGQGGAGE
jgi:hypothetical protein